MPGEAQRLRPDTGLKLAVLTSDAALNRALQELATGDLSATVVPDMRSLTDELMQGRATIALIDAGALDAPVDAVVDAITTQFPDLRLLVAGHVAEQNLLATRIASQQVFRFVHKPASPQRLKLFIDAASRQAPPRAAAAAIATPPPEPLARIETAVRGRSPQSIAIGGVLVFAAIAAAAWIFWPGDASTPSATPAAAPAAVARNPQVAELVRKADLAFAAGRYVAADGSSAAELYRDALKIAPTDDDARKGFDRAVEYGLRSAEEALLAGRVNDASATAETLRLIAPNNSRLAFVATQISREQTRINADASLRQAQEARQAQIRTAVGQMNDRLARGALLDPSTNSALSRFREAEAVGAGDPAVRSARESLVAALLTAADNELTARRLPGARRLIDAAASVNSSAPGLDVLRRRLEESASQAAGEARPAPVRESADPAPAPAAAPVTPPPASVQAAAPAATPTTPGAAEPTVVSASALRLLRSQPAEFPARALEQGISGWVELEFTVARDGSVGDVIVTNAEPRRTFDAAATAALRRYRYAPVIRNGEPVPQRARIRMRFTATEAR